MTSIFKYNYVDKFEQYNDIQTYFKLANMILNNNDKMTFKLQIGPKYSLISEIIHFLNKYTKSLMAPVT